MAKFEIGDMVVLTSGSMRMAVESVDANEISVVWCHEGKVGRDVFNDKLLNKWETREGAHAAPRPASSFGGGGDRGPRPGGVGGNDRGDRGPRPGGFGGDRGDRGDRAPRPNGFSGGDRGDRGPRADSAPRAGGWNNDRGDRPQGDRPSGDRPAPGGWNKDRAGGGDRAPSGPSGYDGRPREKKFFRKDS
ncbi:MAG: hypothetical protein ACJA1L_001649 [Paracoccaceae bacterium]